MPGDSTHDFKNAASTALTQGQSISRGFHHTALDSRSPAGAFRAVMYRMIDALCDPVRTPPRGDEDSPAFHAVGPSIPGFGLSDQVSDNRNNLGATADMFDTLMQPPGYDRYLLHRTGWLVSGQTHNNQPLFRARGLQDRSSASIDTRRELGWHTRFKYRRLCSWVGHTPSS